jgi:hypothetical protein
MLDLEALLHDPSHVMQAKDEVVPMRSELDLQVSIVVAEQEELDHLVLPKSVDRPGRASRWGVGMVGGVDFESELRSVESQYDARALIGRERDPIPRTLDLQHRLSFGLQGARPLSCRPR